MTLNLRHLFAFIWVCLSLSSLSAHAMRDGEVSNEAPPALSQSQDESDAQIESIQEIVARIKQSHATLRSVDEYAFLTPQWMELIGRMSYFLGFIAGHQALIYCQSKGTKALAKWLRSELGTWDSDQPLYLQPSFIITCVIALPPSCYLTITALPHVSQWVASKASGGSLYLAWLYVNFRIHQQKAAHSKSLLQLKEDLSDFLSHPENIQRLLSKDRKELFELGSDVGCLPLMRMAATQQDSSNLTDHVLAQLPSEECECTICREGFDVSQEEAQHKGPLIRRECGHVFHETCIHSWHLFSTQAPCGYCKSEEGDLKPLSSIWLQSAAELDHKNHSDVGSEIPEEQGLRD